MSSDTSVILMDAARIGRSLKRMAHEIAEINTSDRPILLFGIDDRGYAVAGMLSEILASVFDPDVEVIQLPIKNGDTDAALNQLEKSNSSDVFVIVVDDVIFSGQTMFSALKKITDHINISEIHTTALIDRGHRKFPVKAEFYGMELPTKLNEYVSVVVEGKEVKRVSLTNSER